MTDPRRHIAKDVAFTTKALVVSAAAGIPVIGAQLSTAIGILEGERISRRVEAFVAEVYARMSRLEENKLDREYINSNEFQDAVISALQAAKRTSVQGKREWIAASLVGIATFDRPAELDAEAILDTLGGLTARELSILAWVWVNKREDAFFSGWLPDELQGPDYNFHLLRLESAGMIFYRSDVPVFGGDNRQAYVITATFKRLMSLIGATGGLSASGPK